MENHHFSWENPLFLWSCSIAMLNYQRVSLTALQLILSILSMEIRKLESRKSWNFRTKKIKKHDTRLIKMQLKLWACLRAPAWDTSASPSNSGCSWIDRGFNLFPNGNHRNSPQEPVQFPLLLALQRVARAFSEEKQRALAAVVSVMNPESHATRCDAVPSWIYPNCQSGHKRGTCGAIRYWPSVVLFQRESLIRRTSQCNP